MEHNCKTSTQHQPRFDAAVSWPCLPVMEIHSKRVTQRPGFPASTTDCPTYVSCFYVSRFLCFSGRAVLYCCCSWSRPLLTVMVHSYFILLTEHYAKSRGFSLQKQACSRNKDPYLVYAIPHPIISNDHPIFHRHSGDFHPLNHLRHIPGLLPYPPPISRSKKNWNQPRHRTHLSHRHPLGRPMFRRNTGMWHPNCACASTNHVACHRSGMVSSVLVSLSLFLLGVFLLNDDFRWRKALQYHHPLLLPSLHGNHA